MDFTTTCNDFYDYICRLDASTYIKFENGGMLTVSTSPLYSVPSIKNVIFNDPATIVFWSDGTKTVVKCSEDDEFDAEKGLSMAIAKKFKYYDQMKPYLKKYEENSKKELDEFDKLIDECTLSMKTVDHRWTEFIKAITNSNCYITSNGIKEDADDKKTDIPSNP